MLKKHSEHKLKAKIEMNQSLTAREYQKPRDELEINQSLTARECQEARDGRQMILMTLVICVRVSSERA
jgi:hypothetical protein